MKFLTFWFTFELPDVILADFTAFGSWRNILKFYLLFTNTLPSKGLKKQPKHLIMPGNTLKSINGPILGAETPKVTKLGLNHIHFNPFIGHSDHMVTNTPCLLYDVIAQKPLGILV